MSEAQAEPPRADPELQRAALHEELESPAGEVPRGAGRLLPSGRERQAPPGARLPARDGPVTTRAQGATCSADG